MKTVLSEPRYGMEAMHDPSSTPPHWVALADFLDEYQLAAARTDQNRCAGMAGVAFPLLGLFGEIGTLVSALKKKQRENESFAGYPEAIIEEVGDALWYFSNIATRASLTLSEIAQEAVRKHDLSPSIVESVLVPEADRPIGFQNGNSTDPNQFEQAVIALAGKTGLLLNEFHTGGIEHRGGVLASHLADVFGALIWAACSAGVNIQDAAQRNITKINSRWPEMREFTALFDSDFNEQEQLPRKIAMQIIEIPEGGRSWVIQLWNDTEIGSPLTDNKLIEDDYRFHDVFHLAYAAILGWSPCLRALLKVKRKSRSEIDENEDGARAALTEEGVSALVFQHATRLSYFENIKSVEYSLLKNIRDFVAGYEVEHCPLWQWEKAILDGFTAFRSLRRFRRGIVTANLVSRSLTFEPHPNDR